MTIGIIARVYLKDGSIAEVVRGKGKIRLYLKHYHPDEPSRIRALYIFHREGVALTFLYHFDPTFPYVSDRVESYYRHKTVSSYTHRRYADTLKIAERTFSL